MTQATDWFFWALLSAAFAALTAIFAKIGLEGVDSDLATLIRIVDCDRDRWLRPL
jgi:transporter family protein